MATEAQALLEKLDRISEVEAAQKEPLPRSFGPYLLLVSLAKGGMGEVFLARSGAVAGFEKHCVVKTLRPHLTDDREYVARFIDEARVVVQLGHKNVCHVFDVGMVGERYYLAMELIAGKDLRSLADVLTGAPAHANSDTYSGPSLAPRSFDLALAVHIVGEVLEALDYAHRFVDVMGEPLHLVHRDISPQNVMLSFEGEVKLIDFGLAASTVKMEQTSPNVVMGKLAYMAPEQIRGEKLDGRADLFAAAVMLTELCTGERYYAGKTPYEIWSIASSGTFRPRKFNTIEAGLRAILDKALAPDPKDRPASCLELRSQLMQWRQQQNLFADGPGLRTVMQASFKQDIKEHRELLAGVASQAVLRSPTTNPSQPGLKVKEPTRSFARAGDAPVPPLSAPPAVVSSSAPSRSSSSSSASSSASSTEAVNRGEHTGALVKQLHSGKRNALWAAFAGLGIALAIVAFALNGKDPTVGDVLVVPPAPLTPSTSPTSPPSPTSPTSTSSTSTSPTSPTATSPTATSPTATSPTATSTSPTATAPTATAPASTATSPASNSSTAASPTATPTTTTQKKDPKKREAPARAWSDLNASEKVEDLSKGCRLSCVDDLKARLPTWAKNKTPTEMRQFTTDLEACHAGCGKR